MRVLAIVGIIAVAGCDGAGPMAAAPGVVTAVAPSTAAAPIGSDQSETESPNSLPVGSTTQNPVTTDTGVVGVLHLPPTP